VEVSADQARVSGATIFEVAEAAKVSITTVSHVFSGKRPVSEATRQRVVEVAERLAYRPRASARALATGRSMTLAVQFPMIWPEIVFNPYFAILLPAMSEAAVARGYAFALVPTNPSLAAFIEPLIGQRGIDAAILLDPIPGDVFPAALAEAGVPYVSLGRVPGLPGNPRVDQDFDAAVLGILEHLADQGYRRPALLTIPEDISSVADIRAAFERHVDQPIVALANDFSDLAATTAAERLLRLRPRPDAVLCITERQAVGACRAAATLGVAIPDELGVVSLGDSQVASGMNPPVTSLCVFPERAGEALVVLVDEVLNGDQAPPEVVLIPTQLVTRASTLRR
jgi:DNA-binding LacI/PurR family transcriptional regulator